MLLKSRSVILLGVVIGLPVIGISSLMTVPGWLEFPKTIFRALRSEVHLAQFIFHRDPDEAPTRMPILQKYDQQEVVFIAHATGNVQGRPALDSFEGLEASYASGCKYIEADFEWTSDHQLVSAHDWESFFGTPLQAIPTLKTFKNHLRSDGFTQMTFAEVDSWLIKHPDMQLITDVKTSNLKALELFRKSRSFHQIVPQTYSFKEFYQAKKLGFERIILTTYKTYYSTWSLRRFAQYDRPSAITVPIFRLSPELITAMTALDVPILTHSVANRSDFDRLPKGVSGIYSSFMCQ